MVVHDCVLLLCYVCVLCLCEHATCVHGYTLMSTCGSALWVCCVEWVLCRHLWIVSVSSLVIATTRSWQEQLEEGRVQSGSQFGVPVLMMWKFPQQDAKLDVTLYPLSESREMNPGVPITFSFFFSFRVPSFWIVAPTLRTGLPTSAPNLENFSQTCPELCFRDDSSW